MSKKQETISDIVEEMRRLNPEKFLSTPWYCEPLPNRMRSYADRIEAAAKSIEADRDNWRRQALDEDARANAATIKDSLTVGDAAAIREALEALVGVIDNYDSKNPLWWHSGAKGVKPLKDARAAIAEPSRSRLSGWSACRCKDCGDAPTGGGDDGAREGETSQKLQQVRDGKGCVCWLQQNVLR